MADNVNPGGAASTTPPPAENPWAAFGLNPDGTPLQVEPKSDAKPATVTPEQFAELSTKLATAEEKLKAVDGLAQKAAVVDRLIKAISGDPQADQANKGYRDVMTDLKEVARRTNPGFYKALVALEQNPDLLDHVGGSVDRLEKGRVDGINLQAHDRLMTQAKEIFGKSVPAGDLAEMLYPYEVAITQAINSNPELQRQFVMGKVDVVDDIFKRLAKPFVAKTLREKQARLARPTVPKAPPRGGAEPGATSDANTEQRPNLRTPKGRAEFHRNAVNRFFNRAGGIEE